MPVADATTGGRLRGLLLRGEQGVGRGLGKQAKAARRVAKAIWHARRAAQGSSDARRVGGHAFTIAAIRRAGGRFHSTRIWDPVCGHFHVGLGVVSYTKYIRLNLLYMFA